MQSKATKAIVAAVAGAAMSVAAVAAQAAPLGPASAQAIPSRVGEAGNDAVTLAQAVIPHWRLPGNHYRRDYDYYGYRHYGWRGHRGWRHRYYDHDDDVGAAIAGGIFGMALGAIAAGRAPRAGRTVQYCINRFRSYDPASRTYLGYDGRRHSCP